MLVMMVVIVHVVMVIVMMVVMDLWTMVKVCAAVYLIYSFPARCLKHGYQNPVRILI